MEKAIKFIDMNSIKSTDVLEIYGDKRKLIPSDIAKEAVRMVNQWISVKDRLPDKEENVLCYCRKTATHANAGKIIIQYWQGNTFVNSCSSSLFHNSITH